jgi:hypothetical protein
MDSQGVEASREAHHHSAGRRGGYTLREVLVASLVVLFGCAMFAVIVSNGSGDSGGQQAAAAPLISSSAEATLAPPAPAASSMLSFAAAPLEESLTIGETGSLVVTVTNTADQPILVESIRVEVLPSAGSACRPEWFAVRPYAVEDHAPIRVPAGDSARVRLPYTMVDLVETNQDACKGITMPLLITGTGRPV